MISSDKIPKKNILGIPIAVLRLKEIPFIIARFLQEKGKLRSPEEWDKKTIFYVNAHNFNIAKEDPIYKSILQRATLVHASGIGSVLASRILNSPLPERTPTLDFIYEVFAIGMKKGWSFYLLGAEDQVVEKAAESLRKRFPNLIIAGSHHGFFTNNTEIVERINLVKPDVILVGMGSPKQEKWIVQNKNKINAKVFWAVGALFDVISGKRKIAPLWIQRLGFEWAFRLYQEPRRLWKRYFFGNIVFMLTVLREREPSFRKSNR